MAEWALKNGLDANIKSMSQAEKTLLRYQYVMANTTAVQGDFLKTAPTWSNQIRMLGQNFERLGSVIGSGFIAWLRPAVVAINSYMDSIIAAVQRVVNALGQIFGWQMIVDTTGDSIVDDTEGIADAYDDATGAAKKFKQQLLGIDELNNLTANDGGSSSGDDGLLGGLSGGNLIEPGGITFKPIESDIKDLYSLGKKLSDGLRNLLPDDWTEIYEKARRFGTGIADFLNGLIQPETFAKVGKTIAGTIMTVTASITAFAEDADWEEWGIALGEGINNFFKELDGGKLAQAQNKIADGIWKALGNAVKTIEWSEVFQDMLDWLSNIKLSTIALWIGVIKIKNVGKWILSGSIISTLSNIFARKISGNPNFSGGIGSAIFGAFKGGMANVGTQIAASGGLWNFLTLDMAALVGEGAVSTGTMVGASVLGGLAAAVGGFWAGTSLAKFLMGDEAPDMTGWEIAQELWDGIKKGDIWTAFGEWWTDLTDGISLVLDDAYNAVDKWGDDTAQNFVDTKNEWAQAIADWWVDGVEPYFKKETWAEKGENMKKGLSNKWTEFTTWFNQTSFAQWWNGIVDKFSENNWSFSGIKDGLSQAWTNAIESIKEIWNNFAKWLNDKLNFSWDGLNIAGKEIIPSGSLNLGKIPTFANGGFPDQGSLFVAGETYGQSEWLGDINGRTGVVSGAEITGITDAIYQTSAQEMELLREQNNYLIGILNKEFGISTNQIGKAAREYAQDYSIRNHGRQAYQF